MTFGTTPTVETGFGGLGPLKKCYQTIKGKGTMKFDFHPNKPWTITIKGTFTKVCECKEAGSGMGGMNNPGAQLGSCRNNEWSWTYNTITDQGACEAQLGGLAHKDCEYSKKTFTINRTELMNDLMNYPLERFVDPDGSGGYCFMWEKRNGVSGPGEALAMMLERCGGKTTLIWSGWVTTGGGNQKFRFWLEKFKTCWPDHRNEAVRDCLYRDLFNCDRNNKGVLEFNLSGWLGMWMPGGDC